MTRNNTLQSWVLAINFLNSASHGWAVGINHDHQSHNFVGPAAMPSEKGFEGDLKARTCYTSD